MQRKAIHAFASRVFEPRPSSSWIFLTRNIGPVTLGNITGLSPLELGDTFVSSLGGQVLFPSNSPGVSSGGIWIVSDMQVFDWSDTIGWISAACVFIGVTVGWVVASTFVASSCIGASSVGSWVLIRFDASAA